MVQVAYEHLLGGEVHPDEMDLPTDAWWDAAPLCPTTVGYADNGEAWEALECEDMTPALHAALLHGPTSGGVDYDCMIAREHVRPPVIHPAQDFVNAHVLEHYARGGATAADSGAEIALLTFRENTYVVVGTHRYAAVMQNGGQTFWGCWVDLAEDGTWTERVS